MTGGRLSGGNGEDAVPVRRRASPGDQGPDPDVSPTAADARTALRREERSRLLAALVSRFGDLDLAEDAA